MFSYQASFTISQLPLSSKFVCPVSHNVLLCSGMTSTCARRDLRAKAGAPGEDMEICDGHNLSIADGVVMLLGEGDPAFFERAEEVEDFKVRRSFTKS